MKHLFQHALQFPGLVPVHHGILHRQVQKIRLGEGAVALSENGILYNAVLFLIPPVSCPGRPSAAFPRILLRQRVFLKNTDLDLLARKQLIPFPFQ